MSKQKNLVVGGGFAGAVTPLRHMLPGVRVRMADVTNIDVRAKRVDLLQGTRRFPQPIDCDQLIIAVGQ